MRQDYTRNRDCNDTTVTEMRALIGVLYMAGVLQSSHTNIMDLWTDDITVSAFFRLVMSSRRFSQLLRALRFDNINDREERRKTDKLAPIRELFENINGTFSQYYTPFEFVTIDEMLEAFRGRCSFRQYIPSKPAKYGLKIHALVDSRKFYVLNMEIYAGLQPEGPFSINSSPSEVVKRLIEHVIHSGRNVTIDIWYTSVPLVNDLLNDFGLTAVGTLKKNKRQVPPQFVNTKKRPLGESLYGFRENCTLLSYVPKKNKVVLLISSMHNTAQVNESNKPEIIDFYNSTKGGVDTVDQMKGHFSVSRVSCRWPLTMFFTLLNVIGINAYVLLKLNLDENLTRRDFLKSLAIELTKPFLQERVNLMNLRTDIRDLIKIHFQIENSQLSEPSSSQKNKCSFCPKKKNRFTEKQCKQCLLFLCREHLEMICQTCYNKQVALLSLCY